MKTAVITTGGLGTRLLTYTKTNPKTMLPIFEKSHDKIKEPLLRPLLEIIFENLYDSGFRRFCIIVGKKTKKSIINHMTVDKNYLSLLQERNVSADIRFINTLKRLYNKINKCEIKWILQSTPMGFGHALLSAKKFVGDDSFLLHTGDAYFPNYRFMVPLMKKFQKMSELSGMLLLQPRKNLQGYGIAQTTRQVRNMMVTNVQEKPKKPLSNLAILPLYFFKPDIFQALKKTSKGHNCELQVTDAIKTLLDNDKKILGEIYKEKYWFDIGTPQNYFLALENSFKNSSQY
jgi:UTP--glucose-1-phosphate uridylyltransferase